MPSKRRVSPGQLGVGAHGAFMLEVFGHLVESAFGHVPYVVGSATFSKTWRDVDVRVILPQRMYRALFIDPLAQPFAGHASVALSHLGAHTRWSVICAAFTALGKEITGLPIDFQVQSQAEANAYDGPRVPIGLAHVNESESRRRSRRSRGGQP